MRLLVSDELWRISSWSGEIEGAGRKGCRRSAEAALCKRLKKATWTRADVAAFARCPYFRECANSDRSQGEKKVHQTAFHKFVTGKMGIKHGRGSTEGGWTTRDRLARLIFVSMQLSFPRPLKAFRGGDYIVTLTPATALVHTLPRSTKLATLTVSRRRINSRRPHFSSSAPFSPLLDFPLLHPEKKFIERR